MLLSAVGCATLALSEAKSLPWVYRGRQSRLALAAALEVLAELGARVATARVTTSGDDARIEAVVVVGRSELHAFLIRIQARDGAPGVRLSVEA